MKDRTLTRMCARWRVAAWLVLLLSSPSSLVCAAAVRYPLVGHFVPAEGTFEIWFSPLVDFVALPETEYRGIAQLLFLELADGSRVGGSVFSRDRALHVSFSMESGTVKDALAPVDAVLDKPLRRGVPVRLALTWKGRTMRSFLDGQLLSERRQMSGFEAQPGAETFQIGMANAGDVPAVVHAVRMSSVQRSPEELRGARAELDEATLLLDRFDAPEHVDARGRSRAQLVSGLRGELGGVIEGAWSFVVRPTAGIALGKVDGIVGRDGQAK